MTIQEILDDLGVRYLEAGEHHHTRPGWIQLDCPFCGRESHKFHLGYNLQTRHFNCWRCGGHFGPKVLQELGLPARDAFAFYPQLDIAEGSRKRERRQVSTKVPAGIGPLARSHREYLRRRGFDPSLISRVWGVQGIAIAPRLSWRLFIPVIYRERMVSWTTRAIGSRVPQRYISASAEEEMINHKELIYGGDFCNHSIVIVEGPIDAWAIGPGAGALFGTAFSAAQVRKLVSIPRRFICFDSSPDAQRRAVDLARQLACFPGLTENLVIDAKDPGEASPKELKLIRKVARLSV